MLGVQVGAVWNWSECITPADTLRKLNRRPLALVVNFERIAERSAYGEAHTTPAASLVSVEHSVEHARAVSDEHAGS